MTGQDGNPLVSIIVRSCGRLHFLEEAIDSLRKQTYSPLEIVIINDFPEPLPPDLLKSGDGCQVNTLHLKTSRGRSSAANAGIQVASGKYLGFLDDDDVLYPDHVKTAVVALESDTRLGGVYTDLYAATQEPDSAVPSGFKTVNREVKYCRSFCREYLFLDNYIPINAILFHRKCVDSIGYFDEGIEVLEDWDFWIRLALKYDLRHLCVVTGEFRIRSDGTNSTNQLQYLFPDVRKYIYRKHAANTFPLLQKWILENGSKEKPSPSSNSEGAQSRIFQLENLLKQKTGELEGANIRLRRYVNFPLFKCARFIRRKLLNLPPPPPEH